MEDSKLEDVITKVELVCRRLDDVRQNEDISDESSKGLVTCRETLKEVLDSLRSEEVKNEIKKFSNLDSSF